ncbi:MAG: hypothetical protein J6Y17_03280 [Elusimicrobiaceae bacterium]|nr:hypothetical protein [Elusimicrobiaceae bacterium]
MTGIILIFLFVILLAVPGFYIITRAVWPKGSKKTARIVSYLLTVLLAAVLAAFMFTSL